MYALNEEQLIESIFIPYTRVRRYVMIDNNNKLFRKLSADWISTAKVIEILEN